MSDHRELAVKAALATTYAKFIGTANRAHAVRAILRAAEPHLQRMFFERFKEAMLSEEAVKATRREIELHPWGDGGQPRLTDTSRALQAALDQAERLMEEGE